MESLIKLTVKTPNQRIDDIQIDCDLQWTVRRLKEYLQDVYPSKPASSSQRLIYLGKLLHDHDLLQEVFGVSVALEWGARTLHLVCSEVSGSIEEQTTDVSSTATATTTTTPVSTTQSNVTDATDGLRFRGLMHQNSVPSSLAGMQSPFMTAATSMPNLAQWYQFHQQHPQQQQHPWANQYHMHMHQYYQQWQQWQMSQGQWPYNQMPAGQFSVPPSPGSVASSVPPSPSSPVPQQQQQPQQQAQQQPQQQPQQPNQNLRMNAGVGGPVDEDEENDNVRNRDWLDWLYMSLRVVMLFSIIYFYSSTSRFLLVGLLGFIIYLYQGGWFTPRRRVPPQPERVEVPEENEDNNMNENNDVDGEQTNSNEQVLINEPPRPSVFRIMCTFFVSFLTSIIPAAPPELQQP